MTGASNAGSGESRVAYPICGRRFRVLVADDHAVVRAGYRHFLQSHPAIAEIGEAGSGSEALEKLRGDQWHVLLLDISMPDRGGLDILKRVRTKHPGLRVLIISGLPETQYATAVFRGGAYGFLSKELAARELLRAIDMVFQGRKYVSPGLADHLAQNLVIPPQVFAHERLSAQSFQIFLKLANGHEVAHIATELKMSRKTVSAYRTRVMKELECLTVADVVRYALKHHLTQPRIEVASNA